MVHTVYILGLNKRKAKSDLKLHESEKCLVSFEHELLIYFLKCTDFCCAAKNNFIVNCSDELITKTHVTEDWLSLLSFVSSFIVNN